MGDELELRGGEGDEGLERRPKGAEPETVGWARELSSLHFRNLMLRADERNEPIAKQIEAIGADLIRRFEPRDPVEEMLVSQMVWMHARISKLTMMVSVQKNLKWIALYGEQLDRSVNLFRRQTLALAEYRRPRNKSFTAIRQANIAGQQVVASATMENGKWRMVNGAEGAGGSHDVREEEEKAEVSVERRGIEGASGERLAE